MYLNKCQTYGLIGQINSVDQCPGINCRSKKAAALMIKHSTANLAYSESLTKFGQFPSMDTLPAVRAALKELYVLKRIDLENFDLLLFNANLLKPLTCLIEKVVLKTHWGNELNKRFQIAIWVKIKILIT